MALGEEQHSLTYPLITDTERTLLVKLIIAEGGGSGGGGGGGQEVWALHQANVPPVFVPPLNRGITYDLDAPFQSWKWDPDTQTWT